MNDKRVFFRHKLHSSAFIKLSIHMVRHKVVKSKSTKVELQNLSASGLKFFSQLAFPVDDQVMFKFTVSLLKERVTFLGRIVRREVQGDGYEYGVEINSDEFFKKDLQKMISELETRKKKMDRLVKKSGIEKNIFNDIV